MDFVDNIIIDQTKDEKHRLVVRVKTSFWYDTRGLHFKKDIVRLVRKSTGFDFLEEDANNGGADLVIESIENLFDVKDGIYEIIMTNKSYDWEGGYLDDWDYKLIPYTE